MFEKYSIDEHENMKSECVSKHSVHNRNDASQQPFEM